MKKIIITRKLLKESEEKASKTFDAKLNGNDELYSQSKLIELSEGHDAILTSFNQKINKVWVHTCTLDHDNALKNYLARGMKIFKTEKIFFNPENL